MDFNVRHPHLDDLGQFAAGFLVRRDAHAGSVARVYERSDGGGERVVAGGFELVAGVAFAGVDVGHGDAGFGGGDGGGGGGGGGCFGGLGAEEGFVEETV